jgi:predicted metal-binding protein
LIKKQIYKLSVIYATSFCVNWAFLIARGTRLKHERSKGFKASRAIRKAQFTQKRVAYKILLFETTSLKLPNLLKNGFAFAFDSFDKFFKTCQKCNVECVVQGNGLLSAHFALGQLRGSLQRRKMRIYDS